MLDQWLVVISGPQLLDEIRKRPDDEVTFQAAADEVLTDGSGFSTIHCCERSPTGNM